MKKVILLVSLILCSINVMAQYSLDVHKKTIGGEYSITVIPPTLKNLMTLVNCTSTEFKSLMSGNRYYINSEASGKNLVYDNDSLTAYMHNNGGVGITTIIYESYNSAVWINGLQKHMYPQSSVPDLYEELKPYYTKTENGNDYFLIRTDACNYGIIINVSDGCFYTRISKLVD